MLISSTPPIMRHVCSLPSMHDISIKNASEKLDWGRAKSFRDISIVTWNNCMIYPNPMSKTRRWYSPMCRIHVHSNLSHQLFNVVKEDVAELREYDGYEGNDELSCVPLAHHSFEWDDLGQPPPAYFRKEKFKAF